ncbi:MAG TPA: DUF1003 domain-containing protein [Chitinophaga sp.]
METFTSDLSGKEYPAAGRAPGKALRAAIRALIQADPPQLTTHYCLAKTELPVYRQRCYPKLMPLTYGQRLAGKIADFGGSRTSILGFTSMLLAWTGSNVLLLANQGFDPYPFIFILLNLVLFCLAALLAPVIMMSQNREEEKDRLRARNDYRVHLKSEMKIRIIHEKLDHLLINQQQDMPELQQIQISMMNNILNTMKEKNGV